MSNREVILNTLHKRNYHPLQVGDNKFTFSYITFSGEYILSNLIHNPETGLLCFQGIIPLDIGDDKQIIILYYLNHLNCFKSFSRWILSDSIKRVVVESSFNLTGQQLTEQMVSNTFESCYKMIDKYSPGITLILNENHTYLDAYNKC